MSSCNENRLDINCTCSSKFGNGNLTRIYDISTDEYICCGNVGYKMYDATQLSGGDLKDAAALLDDSRCESWWRGTIDKEFTIALPTAAPTTSKLNILKEQVEVSKYFPNSNINGIAGSFSCLNIQSPGLPTVETVPKYVVYPNPNAGEKFIETIQCVPKGTNNYSELKQTNFASTGNFAIYGIQECNNNSSQVCFPPNGIAGISIGSQEYKSNNFNGYITPDTCHKPSTCDKPTNCDKNKNCNNSNRNLWIGLIIVLVIIFIIIIFVLFMSSASSPCPEPPKPVCKPVCQPKPTYYPPKQVKMAPQVKYELRPIQTNYVIPPPPVYSTPPPVYSTPAPVRTKSFTATVLDL